MLERLTEQISLWEHLRQTKKPIFLYGMGNGAEKIISALSSYDIPLTGIFASDGFVRGHSFHGYPVQRLCDVKAMFPDFIALLAFGIDYEPMLSYLYDMDKTCELYAPDVPVVPTDDTLFDLSYIRAHEAELDKVYQKLSDEKSRQVFLSLLNYKVSGKIPYLKDSASPKTELWKTAVRSSNEDFVDLGGYDGDTVRDFLAAANGQYHSISVWEPDPKNRQKLSNALSGLQNAVAEPVAAWSAPATAFLQKGRGGRNPKLVSKSAPNTVSVTADSVDHRLNGRRVSLLKLDVEGSEAEALTGAKETILKFRPAILLSAYHKNEDLFALPLQVLRYVPNYRMFLRHPPYIPAWDATYCFL